MKFSRMVPGHVGVSVFFCFLLTSCNPNEEYVLNEEIIGARDAYCSEAPDLNSCLARNDVCQPAFDEGVDDTDPEFEMCIGNPVDEPTDGSTSGGGTGGTDGSGNGGTSGGTNPPGEEPTIEEAYKSGCKNLDEKYLWQKKETLKKGSKKKEVTMIRKVKICHETGSGSAHSIVIACPALKAHIKHGDDSLGACAQ